MKNLILSGALASSMLFLTACNHHVKHNEQPVQEVVVQPQDQQSAPTQVDVTDTQVQPAFGEDSSKPMVHISCVNDNNQIVYTRHVKGGTLSKAGEKDGYTILVKQNDAGDVDKVQATCYVVQKKKVRG